MESYFYEIAKKIIFVVIIIWLLGMLAKSLRKNNHMLLVLFIFGIIFFGGLIVAIIYLYLDNQISLDGLVIGLYISGIFTILPMWLSGQYIYELYQVGNTSKSIETKKNQQNHIYIHNRKDYLLLIIFMFLILGVPLLYMLFTLDFESLEELLIVILINLLVISTIVFLLVEYFFQRYEVINNKLKYKLIFGKSGILYWSEIDTLSFLESKQCLVFKTKNGKVVKLPITNKFIGFTEFADAIFQNINEELIDEDAKQFLKTKPQLQI